MEIKDLIELLKKEPPTKKVLVKVIDKNFPNSYTLEHPIVEKSKLNTEDVIIIR